MITRLPAYVLVFTVLAVASVCLGAEQQRPDNPVPGAELELSEASDEELVAVLASTHAAEASKALLENVDYYLDEGRIDEIEHLMPKYMATADDNAWEVKNALLGHAREFVEGGDRGGAEQALRQLPTILESAENNTVSQAYRILEERARRYVEEGRAEEMERLLRLLAPVLEDTALDGSRRLHAFEVLRVAAWFPSTRDAVFDTTCRLLVEDPSALVRHRTARALQAPRRLEAIPFLKKAALDERNTVEVHSMSVCEVALKALGRYGPEAAPVLLELASHERRIAAIEALASTRDREKALPALLEIMETGQASEMREAAIGLGGFVRDSSGEERAALLDALRAGLTHPNDSRRQASCAGLASTCDYRLIPLIEPLLDDPAVREDAELAIRKLEACLNELRRMYDIPAQERDMSIDEVIAAWNEGARWADKAIEFRCDLTDNATRAQVYDKLTDLAIQKARLPIMDHDSEWLEAVGPGLRTVTFLGRQKSQRDDAVSAVLKILDATDEYLFKENCYMALGQLGGPRAFRVFKELMLEDSSPRVCGMGFSPMHYLRPEAAPIFLEGIEGLDKKDRYTMYHALGLCGNESVIPFLLEKARAAKAAGDVYEAGGALRSASLKGSKYSPETRQRIAAAVVENARSTDIGLREGAVMSLAEVGDASHIALLKDLAANDPYNRTWYPLDSEGNRTEKLVYPIREAAIESIGTIRERLAKEEAAAATDLPKNPK